MEEKRRSKKRIAVLGAGISGLCLAWFLSQYAPEYELLILEKSSQIGGWLQSEEGDFFFEKGPRTFRKGGAPTLERVIRSLGLEKECIFSNAKERYLLLDGSLHQVPGGLFSLLTSPLTRGCLGAFWKEWHTPPYVGEESVWDFACRRFNLKIAERFFDPLVLGIYAGNAKELSLEACFPFLKAQELQWGSLLKAFWQQKGKGTQGLFSLQKGMGSFVYTLRQKIPCELLVEKEIQKVENFGTHWRVKTAEESWDAEYLFSALPPGVLGSLLMPLDPLIGGLLKGMVVRGVTLVHVGYVARPSSFRKGGFGYLVPSCENQPLLGAVFDSEIFPQQNRRLGDNRLRDELRLTFMLRGVEAADSLYCERVLRALQEHLGIFSPPDYLKVTKAPQALTQYTLGHVKRIEELEKKAACTFPRLQIVGNFLTGVSVEACMERAERVAKKWAEAVKGEDDAE